MKNNVILIAFIIFLIAMGAYLFSLGNVPREKESKVLVTPTPTAPPELMVSPTATPTQIHTSVRVIVDSYGWVNNNNCTIHAVVENQGVENVSFQLTFNGVEWSAKLLPKGKRSAEIPLPFGNVGQGELVVHVRGDVNQTNRTFCSGLSSDAFTSEALPTAIVSPTPTPTGTPPPVPIPEFPSLGFPVVAVFLVLFFLRKK